MYTRKLTLSARLDVTKFVEPGQNGHIVIKISFIIILDSLDVVLAIIFFILIIIVASSTFYDFKLKLRNLGCKRHSEHYKNPVIGQCK